MRAAFFVLRVSPLINWQRSAENGSMSPWLTDIRKTAFVALIATIFGSAYPLAVTIRTDRSALANVPWLFFRVRDIPWYFFPLFALAVVLMIFALAVAFGFPIALYCSKMNLRISIGLRRLALLAAAASTLDWLPRLFRWIDFYSTQFPRRDIMASIAIFTAEQASVITYILFLVAISRHVDDSASPDSKDGQILRRISKAAVVFWSIVLAGTIVGAVIFAFWYSHFQEPFRQAGREFPSLRTELADRARYLLQFAVLWVPPFIVYRSLRVKREIVEIPAEPI
jgi:hypothetical protein